jgi:hypothetical protein
MAIRTLTYLNNNVLQGRKETRSCASTPACFDLTLKKQSKPQNDKI